MANILPQLWVSQVLRRLLVLCSFSFQCLSCGAHFLVYRLPPQWLYLFVFLPSEPLQCPLNGLGPVIGFHPPSPTLPPPHWHNPSLSRPLPLLEQWFFFVFLATPCSMWDLNSLTRARTYVLWVPATGPPERSLGQCFLKSGPQSALEVGKNCRFQRPKVDFVIQDFWRWGQWSICTRSLMILGTTVWNALLFHQFPFAVLLLLFVF